MDKKLTLVLLFFSLFFVNTFAQGLRINEIDYDQISTDTSEFIELYNSSSTPIDLGTYTLFLFNGSGNANYDSIPLPTFLLNAGSYFVICGNAGVVPNCDMVRPVTSNLIQNGSPDAVALWDTLSSAMIDAVSYEGSCPAPYVEGTGVPPSQSDSTFNYTGIGRFPDGADTDDNTTDFHLACITPGTANTNVSTNCQSPVSTGQDLEMSTPLFIYPNPASEKIFIFGIPASNENFIVHVYDITGKLCLHTRNSASKILSLDISSLRNGIYSVVIRNPKENNFTTRRNFIVAR